jgi:hypothetical protein
LLLLIILLYEGFGGGEAIRSSIETHINLVIGHSEVAQVHFYHVVAEAAFFGKLADLILIFALHCLHF